MTIDWNKPLRTVGTHYPVRVICRDRLTRNKYTHVVLIKAANYREYSIDASRDGLTSSDIQLENVPEEMFVNVYGSGSARLVTQPHNSLEEATEFASEVGPSEYSHLGTYRLVPVED